MRKKVFICCLSLRIIFTFNLISLIKNLSNVSQKFHGGSVTCVKKTQTSFVNESLGSGNNARFISLSLIIIYSLNISFTILTGILPNGEYMYVQPDDPESLDDT